MPDGYLAIAHDVAPGHAGAVRSWYAQEHHFERLGTPGFLEVHRYDKVVGEGGAMFNLYRASAPGVFFSEPYRARLAAPTPRTRQCMPHFRAMSRTECRLLAQAGRGEGGVLAVATVDAAQAARWAGAAAAAGAALLALPQLLRLRVLLAQEPPAAGETAETRLRGAADDRVGAVVLLDAEETAAAQQALDRLAGLVGPAPRQAIYRLAFAARHTG